MQQVQPSGKPRSLLSVRNLVIGIVVILLAFFTVHIVYGSSAKHSAHQKTGGGHHAACATTKTHRATCPAKSRVATRKQHRTGAKSHARRVAYRPTSLERYQMQLMRLLDHHRHTFDFVAYSNQIKTVSQLTSACSNQMTRVSIMTDVIDGVPHPGAWYSRVAGFHRHVLQAYHDMESALEVCSTGAGNDDGSSIATARQDLVTATRELHAVDDAAHHAWNHVHRMKRLTAPKHAGHGATRKAHASK